MHAHTCRYEAVAIAMLQRPDAPTLLRHAAALLSAVSAGRLEFVTAFLLHGFADKLTAAEMEAVWLPFLPHCHPSARPSHFVGGFLFPA
jgi:hypothetical protein